MGRRAGKRRPVSDFMTPTPQTIGRSQSLETAHQIMRVRRIRHLPVLDRGRLVGVVSERDLHFIETLKGIDRRTAIVGEAMTPEPYTAHPDTPIGQVVRKMSVKKFGSCVVVDRAGQVVGVFTTVDALRILADLFATTRVPKPTRRLERPARG